MSNLAALTTQRDALLKKLREIEGSGNDVEKILEAIKNQRWYFIKNKPQILFDKNTGLIWANLHWLSFPEFNYSTYRDHIDEKMKEFRNKFD